RRTPPHSHALVCGYRPVPCRTTGVARQRSGPGAAGRPRTGRPLVPEPPRAAGASQGHETILLTAGTGTATGAGGTDPTTTHSRDRKSTRLNSSHASISYAAY